MPLFTVTVTETTVKQAYIEIEADDWEQAEDKASADYWADDLEWHKEDVRIDMDSEEEST